jgi:hypothetical protein
VASLVEGIEERCAAAGAELANALVEQGDVVGEALRYVDLDVKALDEGEVAAMKYLTQELDGGVLIELEALADRTGGVQHDSDAEGKIGLLRKDEDCDRGWPSSSRPKFSRLRPVMKRPFLSVAVKMRFASLA